MLAGLLLGTSLLSVGPARASPLSDAQTAYAAGDLAKAAQMFKTAAEQGDPVAQYNLGVLYENGQGVAKDYKAAVDWYRKGADQGYSEAQNNLANMYTFGLGVPRDLTEAVKWLRLAAQQGSSGAQYNLGLMYTLGQGVPKDYKLAEAWLRLAAQQGDVEAQYNLGVMYERGDGVPQNNVDAYAWYAAAAEQGFAQALDKKAKLEKSLTPEQKAQAEKRAAAVKNAAAQSAAKDAPASAAGLKSLLLVIPVLAAAVGGWAFFRKRSVGGAAAAPVPAAGFNPVPDDTVVRGIKDPATCEKISRYYYEAGRAQEFVSQNQERPQEFYGAFGRGFLKAGHYAAALALLQMKTSPDPDDDKIIWTVQKAMGEQAGVPAVSRAWAWSARLAMAEELSAQGMHAEALAVADDDVLREAAANPGDAQRAAALHCAAGQAALFIETRAEGKPPEFRKAYAAAFAQLGEGETAAKLGA